MELEGRCAAGIPDPAISAERVQELPRPMRSRLYYSEQRADCLVKLLFLLLALTLYPYAAHALNYGPYPAENYFDCKPDKPAPGKIAAIIVHGNWATGGNLEANTIQLCHALAAKGIYAVDANYRLLYSADWPAAFQDVQMAVRWMRHRGYTTVGVAGMSAGGTLSLLAGAIESVVVSPQTDKLGEYKLFPGLRSQADFIIDVSGPPDMIAFDAQPKENDRIIEGVPMTRALAEATASPITFIGGSMPPTIIFEGLTDPQVTVAQIGELRRVFENKGVKYQYQLYRGQHVLNGLPAAAQAECLSEAAEFALTRKVTDSNPLCVGPLPKKN
jgi:acetyl esterase/lipase